MRGPLTVAVARLMGYESRPQRQEPALLLERYLAHAYHNVPYYRELFDRSGLMRGGKPDLTRFADVPLLEKRTLRSLAADLIARNVTLRGARWNSSGGSTGEPTRFMQDRKYLRAMRAVTFQQKAMAGYSFGEPMIKLWGDDRELLVGKRTVRARLAGWLKNTSVLNSFRMNSETMRSYVDIIRRRKPKLLVAYAQALYELCRFAEENGLELRGPAAVMTSAGTLYPFMRETIERVTGCRVFDRYGSRETGNMACECERHEGLHVSDNAVWLEILDRDGRPAPPGADGEIVVTGLLNETMPLIRYRIGDRGIWSARPCSCARPEPLLERVTGRMTDVFRTPDGRVVPAEFFIHMLGVVMNRGAIEKFQVVQKTSSLVHLRVVSRDGIGAAEIASIEGVLQTALGPRVQITTLLVDDIPALGSGKYQYTISEVQEAR